MPPTHLPTSTVVTPALLFDFDEKFDVFPKVDILEKDEALIVRADVPGIKKEENGAPILPET